MNNKKFITQRHKNMAGKDIFIFNNVKALYLKEVRELFEEIKEVLEESHCKCKGKEDRSNLTKDGVCVDCNFNIFI